MSNLNLNSNFKLPMHNFIFKYDDNSRFKFHNDAILPKLEKSIET